MASFEYIIEWMPGPIRRLPNHMDYDGQQKAERIFQVIISVCAVIGFIWGYVEQRFSYTVYLVLGGFFLSCLITLPPWPPFRVRTDLKWQKVLEIKEDTDGKEESKKKKK